MTHSIFAQSASESKPGEHWLRQLGVSLWADLEIARQTLGRFLAVYGWLLVGLLGIGARAMVAQASIGSNDMLTWAGFASEIANRGLGYLYDTNELFNHPPLVGLMAGKLFSLAVAAKLRFEILFKLPIILVDLGSAGLIYVTWRPFGSRRAALAFALFCWSPVSILVTAYHGNTDSLCAGLMLLSVVLVDRKRVFWGGVALAAAINVKLIPALLIPVLLGSMRSWKQACRLAFGLSLGVLPFVPIAIGHWQGFYSHVLNWRGYPGEWGITGLLHALGANGNFAPVATAVNDFWIRRGSLFVLLAPALLTLVNRLQRRRRWNVRELAALTYCIFVVIAPGWGIQYIVYPALLLFVANLREATIYSWVVGVYAFVAYFSLWTGSWPFYSSFYGGQQLAGLAFGYVAWITIARTVVELLRTRRPHLSRA